jgi:hypothetical protein
MAEPSASSISLGQRLKGWIDTLLVVEPLFTPAIGLLMGAAILSGVLGWAINWWQKRVQR